MLRRTRRSTLFPYTTLFRSDYRKKRLMHGNEPKIPEMEPKKGGQYLGNRPFPADALIRGALGPIFLLPFFGSISGIFGDRKSTRLNSSHANISYAVFCLKKK